MNRVNPARAVMVRKVIKKHFESHPGHVETTNGLFQIVYRKLRLPAWGKPYFMKKEEFTAILSLLQHKGHVAKTESGNWKLKGKTEPIENPYWDQ